MEVFILRETKLDVWRRKIRNGKRKQAEAVQREKEKVWDKLKEDPMQRRTLEGKWTVETVYDLEALHGIDVESELAKTLVEEIDKEILNELRKAAK